MRYYIVEFDSGYSNYEVNALPLSHSHMFGLNKNTVN